MATTLSTGARNAACDAVVDRVDVSGPGKIRIKNGATVIAEVLFAATAFGNAGAVNAGEAIGAGFPRNGAGLPAAGTGAVAQTFDVTDGANAVVWSGAVGNGSGELNLNNTNIANGQTVTINSFLHTQPA